MLLHVNDDVLSRDHEQFIFGVKRKDTDASVVGHVFDLSPTGHLMTFHVDQGAQIHDGGIALQDPFKHRGCGNSLHHIGGDVAKGLVGNIRSMLSFHAEVVKGLAVGCEGSIPTQWRCAQATDIGFK